MNIQFETVNNALVREDIEGLIETGAPEDEYASEAKEIVQRLRELSDNEININAIIRVTVVIWQERFNLSSNDVDQRLPVIERVAKKILGI